MSDDYQKEYDKAAAELEAAANGEPVATTAQAEPAAPAAAEPVAEAPVTQTDPVEELRAKLEDERKAREKAEKALKDTQAWGTKNAQALARIERERELAQREAAKPQILAEQPELAEAIRYVTTDPTPQIEAEKQQETWLATVERAHPGIFAADIDPELEQAILARRQTGNADWSDPIVAIAEITAEKLAHAERQIGKRFAAEAAKLQQKSAMSVPSASAGPVVTQPADQQLEEVRRIQSMSDADFAAEVRRVKGY